MQYDRSSIQRKRNSLRSKKDRFKKTLSVGIAQIILLGIFFLIAAGAGLTIGSVEGMIASAPETIDTTPDKLASFIYDDKGNIVQRLYDYDSNRVMLSSEEEIPEHVAQAFIAIEDERFYQHNGVDLKGILRAVITDLTHSSTRQGASTITQQLIKNKAFNVGGEKNPLAKIKRKIQEMYMAMRLEQDIGKEEILRDYLDTINLGKGTAGVETASLYYFGKDAKQLSVAESAVLASITKNPTYLNPVDYPSDNQARQSIVLKKMYELGFISSDEYNDAVNENVYAEITENITSRKQDVYSYFTDAIITQVVSDLQSKCGYTQSQAYNMIYKGGLKIYSTQNTKMQRIANKIINDKSNYPVDTDYSLEYILHIQHEDGTSNKYSELDVRNYFRKMNGDSSYRTVYDNKDAMKKAAKEFKKSIMNEGDTIISESVHYSLEPQLSFCLINPETGAIKVLVGGRGKKNDNLALNRATAVTRQPGSTFKIVSTYAPGIDSGEMTLATVYDDAPYKYENGVTVTNANKSKYLGLTTIREAIVQSDNIVAVKAITDLSPRTGYNYLLKLGFTTLVNSRTNSEGQMESDINQSLALGGITDGVTNVELTAAYASIANEGIYEKPILYTKVVDKEGNVILRNKPKGSRVMKASTAWLLTSAMQEVVTRGTGKQVKLADKMPVAGKTGTTSKDYDFWFCGYTPYYAASIWTGYDLNTTFDNPGYHKVIWGKIMSEIDQALDLKVKKFPACKDLVPVKVCAKSGLLPQEGVCDQDPEKNMVYTEYFTKDSVPKETCDSHVALTMCKKTDRIITEFCPEKTHYTLVYRVRPQGAKGTTDDSKYTLPVSKKNFMCTKHTEEWQAEKDAKQALKDKEKAEGGTGVGGSDKTPAGQNSTTNKTGSSSSNKIVVNQKTH